VGLADELPTQWDWAAGHEILVSLLSDACPIPAIGDKHKTPKKST
jgi:hypothetical protein